MCSFCTRYEYDEFYYKDVFCSIVGHDNELLCIYAWHKTPVPQHRKWIEGQLFIIASKKWGKEWGYRYISNSEHPHWTAKPYPDATVRVLDKKWGKKNITKEIN